MLEQAVEKKKEDTKAMQKKVKEENSEIKKLKCKIEDQKCLHDMLKKKIADERQNIRPNVPNLMKNLDQLKKIDKVNKDKLKLISLEDQILGTVYSHMKKSASSDTQKKLNEDIEKLKNQIQKLKNDFVKKNGQYKEDINNKRISSPDEMTDFDNIKKHITSKVTELNNNQLAANDKIEKLSKTMLAKKLTIPAKW